MQMSQLRPASQLAQRFGVKAVLYGGPGSGKTPMMNTAPRPVLLAAEPGLLSMRNSNVPTWEAPTVEKIDEFFVWLKTSAEARNFDTVGFDSISQIAELVLKQEKDPKRNKDGRAAYGKMADKVFDWCNDLYYAPQKHIVLIAKQGIEDGSGLKKPFFPGQDLNVRIPHMFDAILHLGLHNLPGMAQPVKAIRCWQDFQYTARDRSGNLAELEPPDLGQLFNKAMQ